MKSHLVQTADFQHRRARSSGVVIRSDAQKEAQAFWKGRVEGDRHRFVCFGVLFVLAFFQRYHHTRSCFEDGIV